QNCNIFNDGAFDPVKDPATRDQRLVRLEHGAPITAPGRKAVRLPDGALALVALEDPRPVVVHDAHTANPQHAFALSRLSDPGTLDGTPIGILRQVTRPTYDDQLNQQLNLAAERQGRAELSAVLAGKDTWQVPARG
ncbi:MAG: 2-oxoacid:ferredoxin oxidoreductase subunit beta, partial [Actinocrinis sp.]